MTSIAGTAKPHRARRRRGLVLLPIVLVLAIALLAGGAVAYLLWPRWPSSPPTPNAPALPIVVGEVVFNVPPGALRVPLQRRAGTQERIDLAFLWPSLATPDHAEPPGPPTAHPRTIDRIFVTIAAADGSLAPIERFQTIYPRYAASAAVALPSGLAALSFRDGTPYQGEDLIYDPATPEAFFVRCTRDGAGHMPGICLAERRIGHADLTFRFPRDWLTDRYALPRGIDRLIAGLKPRGG